MIFFSRLDKSAVTKVLAQQADVKFGPLMRESHVGRNYFIPAQYGLARLIRAYDLQQDKVGEGRRGGASIIVMGPTVPSMMGGGTSCRIR